MEKLYNKIESILGDSFVGFDVNDWGSCQYSTALDIFNALNKLDKDKMDWEPLYELGITLSYSDILKPEDANKAVGNQMAKHLESWTKYHRDDYDRYKPYLLFGTHPFGSVENSADWWEEKDRYEKRDLARKEVNGYFINLGQITYLKENGVENIEEAFEIMRSSASDLWTAAPRIAEIIFKDLNIQVEESPGVGPEGNVVVQSGNFYVGICCWLLYKHGFITNTAAFADFDT